MRDTIQSVSKHKFTNILKNIGDSDITYHINFHLFKEIIKQIGGLKSNLTSQRKFLIKMGIFQRAEIISKKESFLRKTDIYYRLKRLVDKNQMGELFKVMFITNKRNKFKLGF